MMDKIENYDLSLVKCMDTLVNPGKNTRSLALNVEKRYQFFTRYNQVAKLLTRELTNPLLTEEKRGRSLSYPEGEYYLTYDALILLIDCDLKKANLPYRTDNILVIKNASMQLEDKLRKIDFNTDDAKIIYIQGVHAIACYISRYNHQMYGLIVDPEGDQIMPSTVVKAVQNVFPSIQLIISTTKLQKDYFSCATFSYQLVRYFCKHGDKVFPYFETLINDSVIVRKGLASSVNIPIYELVCEKCDLVDGYNIITELHGKAAIFKPLPNQLMPPLLKMCQSNLSLSQEQLNSIVSVKNQKSLKTYHEENSLVTPNGNTLNQAAIKKKYNYFAKIDNYMTQVTDKLSADRMILS